MGDVLRILREAFRRYLTDVTPTLSQLRRVIVAWRASSRWVMSVISANLPPIKSGELGTLGGGIAPVPTTPAASARRKIFVGTSLQSHEGPAAHLRICAGIGCQVDQPRNQAEALLALENSAVRNVASGPIADTERSIVRENLEELVERR